MEGSALPLRSVSAGSEDAPRNLILIVDDDPAVVQVFGRLLACLGRVRFALSGAEGLRIAREARPDIVLLDVALPDLTGVDVCRQLKADPALADMPVICITSHNDVEHELEALAAGAVDFIGKPPRPSLLLARVRTHLRLKHLTDALRHSATVDGLTGVANRQRFDDLLASEWLRAARNGAQLSLLMVDVDHFKRFNDHYGHPAGDGCLRAVASALGGASFRPADHVARYGGEEFVVLLPDTDADGACRMAERVLQAVAELALPHADSPTAPQLTVSVGVATVQPGSLAAGALGPSADARPDTPDGAAMGSATEPPEHADLVARADRALYAAKHAGRARFVQDEPARPAGGAGV